jgi:hypothetical protein
MALPHRLYAVVDRSPRPTTHKKNVVEIRRDKLRELEAKKAIDRAANVLDRLEERITIYDAQIELLTEQYLKPLEQRKACARQKMQRLEDQILGKLSAANMERADGFDREFLAATCPKAVQIDNLSLVPGEYIRIKPEADKLAIKTGVGRRPRVGDSGCAADAGSAPGPQMSDGPEIKIRPEATRPGVSCLDPDSTVPDLRAQTFGSRTLGRAWIWTKMSGSGNRAALRLGPPHRPGVAPSNGKAILGASPSRSTGIDPRVERALPTHEESASHTRRALRRAASWPSSKPSNQEEPQGRSDDIDAYVPQSGVSIGEERLQELATGADR